MSSSSVDKEILKQSTGVIKKFSGRLKRRFLDHEINLVTEKFRAYELIDSFGVNTVHKMIDYYFDVHDTPSWKHFLKNSSKVRRSMIDKETDIQTRKKLAEQAKRWLNK